MQFTGTHPPEEQNLLQKDEEGNAPEGGRFDRTLKLGVTNKRISFAALTENLLRVRTPVHSPLFCPFAALPR